MVARDIDELAEALFGMKSSDAIAQKICVMCRQPIHGRIFTLEGNELYLKDGACEVCYNEALEEPPVPIH